MSWFIYCGIVVIVAILKILISYSSEFSSYVQIPLLSHRYNGGVMLIAGVD